MRRRLESQAAGRTNHRAQLRRQPGARRPDAPPGSGLRRAGHRGRRSALVALLVVLCLLAAACSSDAAGDPAGGESVAAIVGRSRKIGAAGRDLTTTTVAPPVAVEDAGPTGDGSVTSGTQPEPITSLPTGSGADPTGLYRGVLGALGADDVVASSVADPPPSLPGVLPLTGQPGDVPDWPAAVVKVDNSPPARPQTGLNAADIVIEEEVEGGVTRFAAIFHSVDAAVGPVRSARTTDLGVLMGLGSPLLLYSGANDVTNALIGQHANIEARDASRSSGYRRDSSRKLPSNLYTDTGTHWASASAGPPPAQFAYRDPAAPVPGTPASSFSVTYLSNPVSWRWDGARWLRSQGSGAHLLVSGEQVSAANVVVIEAERVDTGLVDSIGATVPEFLFVGTGPATVFSGGKKVVGTWTRPTLASVATLTTADGRTIELSPGRTWIELIEVGAGGLR